MDTLMKGEGAGEEGYNGFQKTRGSQAGRQASRQADRISDSGAPLTIFPACMREVLQYQGGDIAPECWFMGMREVKVPCASNFWRI